MSREAESQSEVVRRGALRSYVPVALVILLSPVFFQLVTYVPPPDYAPFPDQGAGPVLNAAFWVGATSVFGLILVVLIRARANILRGLLIAFAVYTVFTVNAMYLEIGLAVLGLGGSLEAVVLAVALSAVSAYALLRKTWKSLYSVILVLTMTGIGTIFNVGFQGLTKIAILVGYAAFDFFSVYRGFLREAFRDKEKALNVFEPLLVRLGSLSMGVGDIIFYALMLSFALQSGTLLFLLAALTLVVSHTLNLWTLTQTKIIPALPIPVAATLAVILLGQVLI